MERRKAAGQLYFKAIAKSLGAALDFERFCYRPLFCKNYLKCPRFLF